MLLFVKRYKMEVLGVGEVALPGDSEALREATNQKEPKEQNHGDKAAVDHHRDHGTAAPVEPRNGTENDAQYVKCPIRNILSVRDVQRFAAA